MSEAAFVGAVLTGLGGLCGACAIAFLLIASDAVGPIRLWRRKPRQKPPRRF